jgi:hypothetical protein
VVMQYHERLADSPVRLQPRRRAVGNHDLERLGA